MTRTTTGDPVSDAVLLLAVVAGLLLLLIVLAVPAETTEVGRRWSMRLLEAVFGPLPWDER